MVKREVKRIERKEGGRKMSWSVSVVNKKGKCLQLKEKQTEGGTICVGGSREASFDVTYNYRRYYYMYVDKEKGIKLFDGMTMEESIPILKKAIGPFKDCLPYEKDYWADTPGNCVEALRVMLRWAEELKEKGGRWEVC